jgi:hypothetical protein
MSKKVLSLVLTAFFVLVFNACGPSGQGVDGSGEGGGDISNEPQVNANEVQEAGKEAVELEKENHELREEIFKLKNKLGLPTD